MDLIKNKWTKKDGDEFQKYLESLRNDDKIEWTKQIVNTKMPVLAIKSPVIKDIAKNILKGNYESFLDLKLWKYHENTTINATIISEISDMEKYKKYLTWFSEEAENWSSCDTLYFNIKGKEKEFINISNEFIKSDKPFKRRIGVDILFPFVKGGKYLQQVFKTLNSFEDEDEYYVNMVNAWLFCECFIKQRDETLKFLNTHKLNKFTINKGVQKCRDSYRVSDEDKEMLLKYKVK